jgi:ParB-like chromosome segregation protein Spo0J
MSTIKIPAAQAYPNQDQPRKKFDPLYIHELAISFILHGQRQAATVVERPKLTGELFMIVAGECRWRGVVMANEILAAWRADFDLFQREAPVGFDWKKLPASIPYKVEVEDLTDEQIAEIALIENVTRRDLSPIEEANGYAKLLIDRTEENLAARIGKPVNHIRRRLRLLTLADEIQSYVDSGQMSVSHAEALVLVSEPKHQIAILGKWIKEGLTVDQVRALGEAYNAKAADTTTIALFDQAAFKPTAAQRRAQRKLDELLGTCGKLLKGCTDEATLELIPTLRGLTGRDLEKVRLIIKGLCKIEHALRVGQSVKSVAGRKRA